MSATRLLLPGLLLAPLLGLAQTSSAPTPRYYVGLALYASDYQRLGGNYIQGTQIPAQLTLGYQWRPRLAVQLSAAYSSADYSYFGIGRYYPGGVVPPAGQPGVYFDYYAQGTRAHTSLALLGRYTLTRNLAHRFQVDALGGLVLELDSYREAGTRTDSARSPIHTSYNSRDHAEEFTVRLGPSLRYRLSRHLEANLDVTFNKAVGTDRQFTGITGATALGLRYRFGYW